MAHEKTWQYSAQADTADNTSAQLQSGWQVWWMVQFLLGRIPLTDQNVAPIVSPQGVWTIEACGDGTTFATDGTDLWGSTYDSLKLVWAFNGTRSTAHSYMTLKAPASFGAFWLTFELLTNASSWNGQAHIICHWTQPTGASASSPPLGAGSTTYRDTVRSLFDTTTPTSPRRLWGHLSIDGSVGVLGCKNGSGDISFLLGCWKLLDSKPADNTPFGVFYAEYQASGAGGNTWTTLDQKDNGGPDSAQGAIPACSSFSGITIVGTGPDPVDGSYPDLPIWVIPSTRHSFKGRLPDWRFGPRLGDGVVDPATGQVTDSMVGYYWTPANAVPVL